MDSPALAPFEDAQEFSSSVLDAEPLAVPKPAPPNSVSQTASPAPEEYTTAPSTPGLSTGGDPSPRNSLLITPTYTRTLSGLRDCVVDIDSETNTTPMEVLTPNVGAMPVYQAPKDNLQLTTTPLAGLVSSLEFVPATTLTAERPIESFPTNTVTPKYDSKLSMSSLRASAPNFAPSFAPASLRAAAPTFVPSQGFVPVVEPAAPPQPAPRPSWAKFAVTEPKKAEVQPVAVKVPKEVDSVVDKETPELKLSEPEAEKEQDEVEAESSATPTAAEEPQGEKTDEELPRTVVTEEDSAEPELEAPILESVDEDASPPAVSVQEDKRTEIEEDVVEQNGVADELPVEEEQAATIDIFEEAEIQEDKKEEIVEVFAKEDDEAMEDNLAEQDNLPEQSEEPEHGVIEESTEQPQPTKISGLTHVFVWASPSEDKIEETHIEQYDADQESLLEEREESNHIATEETAKRLEQPVEKISGLTHVFLWGSPSENKPTEEQVSGLKHVFIRAGSDAQQLPESQALIAPAQEMEAEKCWTVPEAEPAEEEPIPSEENALDNIQTESEQQPEIQTSCAAPEDKKAEVGPEISAGLEDASAAIPELSSERSGEESGEKVEDVATSEPEVVEDQSAVQPETGTQVAEAPTVEEQAAGKAAVVQDTNCEGGIQADSGSDLENLEPDISEEESTQAPSISVQDFAPSAPSDDVSPPKDTPAPPPTSFNDSLTSTITQLDTFSPTFLAPSPALSVRSSVSSFAEWSTYERPRADLSRGSVDTIHVSSDMPTHSEPESSRSRPQTAGYLGLGLGGADMGFCGALGDSRRRLNLPLKNLFVAAAVAAGHKHGHDEVYPKSQETTAVGTPDSSVAGDDAGTPSKPRKRRLGEEGVEQNDGEVKNQEKEDAGLILAEEAGPSVLPRMMMLFAGVMAVGKALKKPSVY